MQVFLQKNCWLVSTMWEVFGCWNYLPPPQEHPSSTCSKPFISQPRQYNEPFSWDLVFDLSCNYKCSVLNLCLGSDHKTGVSDKHFRLACRFLLHNHHFQCHGRPSTIIRRPKHMSKEIVVSKMSSTVIVIKMKVINSDILLSTWFKTNRLPALRDFTWSHLHTRKLWVNWSSWETELL